QAHLLGELLDLARINSGTLRLDHDLVDLAAVLSDAWEVVEPAARSKNIEADLDFGTEIAAPALYGDAARLRQILSNLFSNAVKFTPNGGRVSARIRRGVGVLEVVVADTGRGIPARFLPFVFEPFRQADSSTMNPDTG